MRKPIVWLIAGLLLGAGLTIALYGVFHDGGGTSDQSHMDQTRLDQAVTARQEADRIRDSNERANAQWGALAADPASPVIGNPNGDVTIVVFSDYACAYCKAAEPRLMAAVDGDKQVRLVMKEFPILTPESMIASRVALVASAQSKYRPFHEALMGHQGALTQDVIFETARDVGLNMQSLQKDMQAPEVTAQIIANYNLARAIRAFQTPAYLAGGARGAHVLSSTSASIDFRKEIAVARGG
jgi:protein-disulfide isomerase